ncbi:hypothetical protein AeMF1_013188 [Aphanomyces euteiches]|nr:hypothetical protein AeMF1_013188 [Aphanomyces euteiches]KAH9188746.1 hypothetical protein AeNC1_009274 [Aphanomyces euteiches]
MNSCNDVESDSSDKAEGARRKYFQCKQREYRHRLKNERAGLLEALARMQSQLSKLPPTKLVSDDGKLSWKVVAAVFQEESKQSKENLHHLQDLVDSNSSLIFEIMRFLRACKPRPGPIISEEQPMNYNVTLMANGAARLHAKQWLVQQLYHNTSQIFHNFPVTDASDEFTQIRAECSGPWVHIVERTQVLFPYPLEDIKRFFLHPQSQEIICLTDEIDVERDGNTVLAHGRFNDAVGWHLLQGHFFEADRFVVVHRHIYDDEAVEGSGDPDYHEMEWCA